MALQYTVIFDGKVCTGAPSTVGLFSMDFKNELSAPKTLIFRLSLQSSGFYGCEKYFKILVCSCEHTSKAQWKSTINNIHNN